MCIRDRHGAQPEAFVVCHEAGRTELSGFPGHKTGTIAEIIELTTILSRRVAPNIRCAGICINTARLPEAEARAVLAAAEAEHDLPATDPVRFGVTGLVDRLLAAGVTRN